MRRASWPALGLAALTLVALALAACDGREVSVFELPAHVAPGGSAGATAGSSGNGGSTAGTNGGSAGANSGGSQAGAGSAGANSDGGTAGGLVNTSGASGSGGPASCNDHPDCMPGWICEKKGCDAPTGVCVPWPPVCKSDYNPVCGCDGVTYWNDCLRLRSYARLAEPDICRAGACTCEVGADCNVPYASCSHLLPPGEMCGHGMGACWVLPAQCPPPAPDEKLWRECKPPEVGPPACLDTCSAIATEHSYAELHRGDVCNPL